MIDVRLLGSFEARQDDGQRIRPPGRRSLALLACLAVEDRPWWRTDLAALLWPDRGPEQARGSLRQELLRLRTAFGPVLQSSTPDPGVLPQLDRERLDVDVFRFLAAAADPARAIEGIALYRGELLENLRWPEHRSITDWLTRWRAHMRTAAILCLRRLLARAEASEPIALRLAELLPGCEEAHAWLIRHHAEAGDVSRAIEGYHVYAQAARAAGREPGAAIEALLARLLAKRRPSRPAPSRAASSTGEWIARMSHRADEVTVPAPRPLAVVSDRPSIVVLPFSDLSPEAGGALLTDGLTEEATNALARMPGFFVTSRHSAMAYKGVAADVRGIAAELGVRYIMEGSLEHRAGRVRVNARLIDGSTGLHIWADRHELAAREVLDVRDEIVQAIAARLQPSLVASEIGFALRRPTEQLDAWGWMQRALGALLHLDQRREALTRAVHPLQQALELDPAYAMAHALLSAVYTWRTLSYAFADPDGERKLARRHAQTALRLEPDNPFVLVHCAETAIYSAARIDDARAMLEVAVNRNPNDAHCLAMLGNARRFAGDDARTSLALMEQAMRLSPRDPRSFVWLHFASWCHWKAGEFGEMEATSRRSVDLYPAYPHSWIALTCALGLQDKATEAKQAAKNLHRLHPKFGATNFYHTARRFYGHRFPGAVSAEYRQLRGVLVRAGR